MEPEPIMNTSTMSPAMNKLEHKDTAMRAVVGVFCSLSILGSLLIICSYILFKKRRTRAREILLHISLMDLGVALSNLIGLSVYFDRYYVNNYNATSGSYDVSAAVDGLCKAEAFVATYCTLASILWTIALAGFLYFLIIHHMTRRAIHFLKASYLVCYALPLLVTLWLLFTKRLGYSPLDSSGWCSIIGAKVRDKGVDVEINLYSTVLGYDLWVYLAIITIPIFYLSIRCHLASQVKEVENYISPDKFWSSLHHVDYKFLIIPVVFVFLRVWTEILSILYDYIKLKPEQLPSGLNGFLFYLSGIGDSSQGFANAILFVIFTKNIRDSFLRCFRCRNELAVDDELKAEGQIQSKGSTPTSHLSLLGSGPRPMAAGKREDSDNSSEVEIEKEEERSLVFGSLGSGTLKSSEQSDYFRRYGAVS